MARAQQRQMALGSHRRAPFSYLGHNTVAILLYVMENITRVFSLHMYTVPSTYASHGKITIFLDMRTMIVLEKKSCNIFCLEEKNVV